MLYINCVYTSLTHFKIFSSYTRFYILLLSTVTAVMYLYAQTQARDFAIVVCWM